LAIGERLARLEWYEEISNEIPASFIEKARNRVHEKYPFSEQDRDSSGLDNSEQEAEFVFQKVTAFVQRLKTSLFGGFVLVVPMLIMTLHPTLLTALLTTSGFVFAVAVVIAVLMDTAEPKDVLGTTLMLQSLSYSSERPKLQQP